jgi:hypothetical protein
MPLQWQFEKSKPGAWYWTRTTDEEKTEKRGPFGSFVDCIMDAQNNGFIATQGKNGRANNLPEHGSAVSPAGMFRRWIGQEIWHSVPTCPFWPLRNFEERQHPTIGRRCRTCLHLEMDNMHRLDQSPQ